MRERRQYDEPEIVRRLRAGESQRARTGTGVAPAAALSSNPAQQSQNAKQGHRKPVQSEKQFMQQVIALARLRRWLVFHPYDSRHSVAGWPDLVCCRPPRLLLIEVKTERGRATVAQRAWLDALQQCPGVEVFLWTPRDWIQIQEVLA
jgi:hypothetical protein